tara:strand:+ start:1333 stop:2706 length:1374 start_codon:yes stop_codon:yes gene_type:complete
MTNFTNPYYYDNLDPDFYMYLYPELKLTHAIDTVEEAYEYYLNNGTPYVPDRTTFLQDFNHEIYYHFYSSNIEFDNYIADTIRDQIIEDKERLSIIHYTRRGHTSYLFKDIKIDSNFNPYLYKVMHHVTTDITDAELYMNYLDRKESDEAVVVGNINELTYHITCNITLSVDNLVIDDTLTVKENLIVQKDAYILGNFGTDATGVYVNGGSMVVNNEYSDINRLFSFHRLSSNSLALGDQLIEAITDSDGSNLLNITGGNVQIGSNLYVEDSIMIGEGLIQNDLYSLQTNKKILISGTDYLSDERFKTNINDINGVECLEKIKQVEIKEYNLQDDHSEKKVGVIAQQMKNIFPNIVSESYTFLPVINIHALALSANTLTKVAHELNINETLLIKDDKQNIIYTKITEITEEYIKIEKHNLNIGESYLIYGKEIKDGMSVDYTQLFCYMLKAFQELIK